MNYQKEMEKIIDSMKSPKKLLLHSCCAPCSSYVIHYLSDYFKITVFYYNPNITDRSEYEHRVSEQKRLISEIPAKHKVEFIEGDYAPQDFYGLAKGFEDCKEGGERCRRCYRLRLLKTSELAKKEDFDYATTTLTISPLKLAEIINIIGKEVADDLWLCSDFKKKEGYKKSIELSKEYNLYRQNYCGCEYSKNNLME